MRKVYISLGGNPLSVDVQVGNRLLTANFTGGLKNPIVIMPKFSTDEEDFQQALEASPSFNTSFELIPPVLDLEEVTFLTGSEAKEWIHANKGIPYNKVNTKASMVQVFADHGMKLNFANE